MEDSISNSNTFLTLPVVDAVHSSTASSDAGSLSFRTPSHEVFGGIVLLHFHSSFTLLLFCPQHCKIIYCKIIFSSLRFYWVNSQSYLVNTLNSRGEIEEIPKRFGFWSGHSFLHFSHCNQRSGWPPYTKYLFPSSIWVMFILLAFNILWLRLFCLLSIFLFERPKLFVAGMSVLISSNFVFPPDHYSPFFDSSPSLASDLDTSAQIETIITGTTVGESLADRE